MKFPKNGNNYKKNLIEDYESGRYKFLFAYLENEVFPRVHS